MKHIFGTSPTRYAVPLLLFWLALFYVVTALSFTPDARGMPLLIGALLLVMAPIDLVSLSDTAPGRALRGLFNPAAGEDLVPAGSTQRQLHALAWVLTLAVLMALIGILAAVPLYIAGSMFYLGGRSWRHSLVTAALVAFGVYGLFQLGLGVDLYPGLLLKALLGI